MHRIAFGNHPKAFKPKSTLSGPTLSPLHWMMLVVTLSLAVPTQLGLSACHWPGCPPTFFYDSFCALQALPFFVLLNERITPR